MSETLFAVKDVADFGGMTTRLVTHTPSGVDWSIIPQHGYTVSLQVVRVDATGMTLLASDVTEAAAWQAILNDVPPFLCPTYSPEVST